MIRVPEDESYTLKQWRNIHELTLKDAAERIGISERTLLNYEQGNTYPGLKAIEKITAAYGVPYSRIIFCPKITDKP